jgi:hypothetical protein
MLHYYNILQHVVGIHHYACLNPNIFLLSFCYLFILQQEILSFRVKKSQTVPGEITIFQGKIALFFASLDPEIG